MTNFAFPKKIALAIIGITFSSIVIESLPAQAANLITNGSFEIGPNPGSSFILIDPGSTAITGWTVTGPGAIDYVADWQASDGTRSLDLNGPSRSGIRQTFNTIAGQSYLVNFDLAGNFGGLPVIKSLAVQAAGQSEIFSFDTTGKSVTNMGWETKTWQFTATSATTTLEFLSNIDGIAGPALDNVSVTEITSQSTPEPLTNPLTFLVTVIGLGLYQQKRPN